MKKIDRRFRGAAPMCPAWVCVCLVLAVAVAAVQSWRLWERCRAARRAAAPEATVTTPAKRAAADGPFFLRRPSVIVTVRRESGYDVAVVTVACGTNRLEFSSEILAGDGERWDQWLAARVGWKGGYLFVASDSGGVAWRAALDHVLKVQDGELVEVGTIARNHQESSDPLAPGYDGTGFHDIYDGFCGDVGAWGSKGVGWMIAMTEEGGRFVVDLDQTWAENQGTIEANRAALEPLMAQGGGRSDGEAFERQEDILARLGENVLIALYCRRDREARLWMGQARRVLDRDHFRRLMDLKRRVEPGALPVDEL